MMEFALTWPHRYGMHGVRHCIQLLRDEFIGAMRMMGCQDLSQIVPDMVITSKL